MTNRIKTFLAVLSLAVFAATAQANLLQNGSFENMDASEFWSSTDNVPDGMNGALEFSESVWAASDGLRGVWFKSFEGEQDMGDPAANASISQTVSGVAQSGDYILTFQSARETFVTADSFPATLSSSGGGSVSMDLLTATYNDDGNMGSDPTTFSLMLPGVNAGDDLTVSVEMVNGRDALMNPQSLMVDNFTLDLVPEPAALALLGLGFLGVLGLRRRR